MTEVNHRFSDASWRRFGRGAGTGNQNTPLLPFDLAAQSVLSASPQKVWAHYFVTFPLGGDGRANSSSWYPNRMPGGTMNTEYGGELRDRPVDPFSRPRSESSWWVLDRAQEVQWAIDAGIDGMTVDWLNLNDGSGDNRTGQFKELIAAVNHLGVQNTFKLIPMPDGTTSICDGGNLTAFINKTAELADEDCLYRLPDGRLVIAPYYPEGAPSTNPGSGRVTNTSASATLAYWTEYKNRLLSEHGIDIVLWFCYVRNWTSHATTSQALNSIAYGHGRWGDRDAVTVSNNNTSNAGAPAYCHTTFNKGWMHPVAVQDNRCNTSEGPKFWESWNSETFRGTWTAAINGINGVHTDCVQIPTWSDFREHAHIIPSANHGYCWVDINAYYMSRYKTGTWPTITRDCIYLSHRIHRSDNYTSTGTQTNFMGIVGGTSQKNDIEALCFLTATANTTVEITANGNTTSFTPDGAHKAQGGAGVYSFKLAMPASGIVSARIIRNSAQVAAVTSPFTITTTPVAQDMHYRVVSSLRSGV